MFSFAVQNTQPEFFFLSFLLPSSWCASLSVFTSRLRGLSALLQRFPLSGPHILNSVKDHRLLSICLHSSPLSSQRICSVSPLIHSAPLTALHFQPLPSPPLTSSTSSPFHLNHFFLSSPPHALSLLLEMRLTCSRDYRAALTWKQQPKSVNHSEAQDSGIPKV